MARGKIRSFEQHKPGKIIGEANRIFDTLKDKGFNGRELRQISTILSAYIDTVPDQFTFGPRPLPEEDLVAEPGQRKIVSDEGCI